MITREQFKKLVELKKRLFKFCDDIEELNIKVVDSEVFSIPGDAIDLIISTNFTDEGFNLVNWWLYDDVIDKKIIDNVDGEEVESNVEDVDDLFDYLLSNNYILS